MSRPFSPRSSGSDNSYVRVNGKIRAREVRVIGVDGQQIGIISLSEAINMARTHGVDLVEIAANANPPVCRLIDYGKFRYEQSKKDKEAKKHQHANKVKEIQLSVTIDPHDFGVKLSHAIDFLCEEMKVKVSLRFRGREMVHQELGHQVIAKFIKDTAPYGHPDSNPKLVGRSINVMFSPLPRNKRAKNPREIDEATRKEMLEQANHQDHDQDHDQDDEDSSDTKVKSIVSVSIDDNAKSAEKTGGFSNNPFAQINVQK